MLMKFSSPCKGKVIGGKVLDFVQESPNRFPFEKPGPTFEAIPQNLVEQIV